MSIAAIDKLLLTRLTLRSRVESADIVAMACCEGMQLRNEIEVRDASKPELATRACAAALITQFVSGTVDEKIQAHVICAERD